MINIILYPFIDPEINFSGLIIYPPFFPSKLPECYFSMDNIEERRSDGRLVVCSDYCNYSSMKMEEIHSTDECETYILQVFAYLQQKEVTFGTFFDFDHTECEGMLFEYYLLLLERYFNLLAAEQDESGEKPRRLMTFSEDDEVEFLNMKKQAMLLLNMLALTSFSYPESSNIPEQLLKVIYLFIEQCPDAFFIASIAKFQKSGIDSLFLADKVEDLFPCANESSFFHLRLKQSQAELDNFPDALCMHIPRFSRIFLILLSDYCHEYSRDEIRTAMLNVTLFVIYSLTSKAAAEIAIRAICAEKVTDILVEIKERKQSILDKISDVRKSRFLQHKLYVFFGA